LVGLLDVNVLVALFDPWHVHHSAAHSWFAANREQGWATCPITENGLLRIVTNPGYAGRATTVPDLLDRLSRFRSAGNHSFWPDDISLCDTGRVDARHFQGHRQLTDVYLLALAVAKRGRLITFDQGASIRQVLEAGKDNLVVISG
jgi:uncharacterized protein